MSRIKISEYVDALITALNIGGKQDALVSGTNIKTINGSSILGSGDLTVQSQRGVALFVQAEEPEDPQVDDCWIEIP